MKFRIMSNGVRYKIQRKSTEEGIFFKADVWNDLGEPCRLVLGDLTPTYYDTLEAAKSDFERFVEHDKKLHEWLEVKI